MSSVTHLKVQRINDYVNAQVPHILTITLNLTHCLPTDFQRAKLAISPDCHDTIILWIGTEETATVRSMI